MGLLSSRLVVGRAILGTVAAARAAPDGYTVLFHSASFSAAYVTHKTLPYDTLADFTAIIPGEIQPSVPVVALAKAAGLKPN